MWQTNSGYDSSDGSNDVPEIGCLVNGLYLDGAAWCHVEHHLIEPKNAILYDRMATVSHSANIYNKYTENRIETTGTERKRGGMNEFELHVLHFRQDRTPK